MRVTAYNSSNANCVTVVELQTNLRLIHCEQVHPYKLTNTFIDEAARLVGSKVVIGTVEGVTKSGSRVTHIQIDGESHPADIVVIAMGPWTQQAAEWFSNMPLVKGHLAHSIVLKPHTAATSSDAGHVTGDVTAHCVFAEYTGNDARLDAELYPRPDGTVYACGFSESVTMPRAATDLKPNARSIEKLKNVCGRISQTLLGADVIAEQVCSLPTPQGRYLPAIGKVPGMDNVYMAAGHTCWGILTAPATGKAMAELIVDGECSFVDLSPFDPCSNS